MVLQEDPHSKKINENSILQRDAQIFGLEGFFITT
jgi:hypothetical protein